MANGKDDPEGLAEIIAREILDSRGEPTIEVEVRTWAGRGIATAPCGLSVGTGEAPELRDGDPGRYGGRGVLGVVDNINEGLGGFYRLGGAYTSLVEAGIERGAGGKMRLPVEPPGGALGAVELGANGAVALSLACAQATANSDRVPLFVNLAARFDEDYSYHAYDRDAPGEFFAEHEFTLPVPQITVISGGAHADTAIEFQDFMVLPLGFERYSEALRCGADICRAMREVLKAGGLGAGVGDSGGFAPQCRSNEEAAGLVMRAIERAGYRPGEDVVLALDAASTRFYQDGSYRLDSERLRLDSAEFADYLANLTRNYPIASIEDGMAEDDSAGWALLTRRLGERVQLTGDDVFATNEARLNEGAQNKIANSISIKPNQAGCLAETAYAILAAREAGYGTTISCRSGETADTSIADLAVASGATQIKAGSLNRFEHVAKYNRLSAIERLLDEDGDARYVGRRAFAHLADGPRP